MFVNGVTSTDRTKINFKSSQRVVYDGVNVVRKNTTKLFRDDLDWKSFVRFLGNKYKNVQNVNVINCACSDGSEPWSLAIMLKHVLGDSAGKFYPIKASDSDAEILAKAKSGICNIHEYELYKISAEVGHYSNWFAPAIASESTYDMALSPKDSILESVKFKKGDVFAALSTLKPKDNVVLLRNFWKYLNNFEQERLVKILSDSLDSTSVVVIGELERGNGQDKLLRKAGFVETPVAGVFQKPVNPNVMDYRSVYLNSNCDRIQDIAKLA